MQQNEQFLSEENGIHTKIEQQEGRNKIHETTGKEENIEKENKGGKLIQRRKIQ